MPIGPSNYWGGTLPQVNIDQIPRPNQGIPLKNNSFQEIAAKFKITSITLGGTHNSRWLVKSHWAFWVVKIKIIKIPQSIKTQTVL